MFFSDPQPVATEQAANQVDDANFEAVDLPGQNNSFSIYSHCSKPLFCVKSTMIFFKQFFVDKLNVEKFALIFGRYLSTNDLKSKLKEIKDRNQKKFKTSSKYVILYIQNRYQVCSGTYKKANKRNKKINAGLVNIQ